MDAVNMSPEKESCDTRIDSNGKNVATVTCMFCPSKVLSPGTGTLVNQEFSLPHMTRQGEADADEREAISECWTVKDIFDFENILVSKTADNVKYLGCADCERGPIGWHDLDTKKAYIALSRVRHAS